MDRSVERLLQALGDEGQSERALSQALGDERSSRNAYWEGVSIRTFNDFIAGLANEVITGKITKQQAEDKLKNEADRLWTREDSRGRDPEWIKNACLEGMRRIGVVREPSPSLNQQSIINNTTYNAPVVPGGDYVNGDKIIHNHPPESAPDTQTPEAGSKAQSGDPVKQTLLWLKSEQYITLYTEAEKPAVKNGAIEYIEPSKKEWRIARAKTVASVFRKLCMATENRQIPLATTAIPDFMINNLKDKNGKDITKNAVDKAAKARQSPPKSS